METQNERRAIADQLLTAYRDAATLAPITASRPTFDDDDGYAVLDLLAAARKEMGWQLAGRKIGFTNRTIWELYGVDRPFWAHLWAETVVTAVDSRASIALQSLVQPRIEPEVVFKLQGAPPVSDDPVEILACAEWMAPGFEIVQCPFPDWKFAVPDCIAAFGLHGALVVGNPVVITDDNRAAVAATLPGFEVTLSKNGSPVDHGVGANVLDSPALALAHLATVLATQPEYASLSAGEIVTTGTVTNAWSIAAGETWSSDYGSLGLDGLTVTFT